MNGGSEGRVGDENRYKHFLEGKRFDTATVGDNNQPIHNNKKARHIFEIASAQTRVDNDKAKSTSHDSITNYTK